MVNKVGVVGLGTMGAGIAEVFAKGGLQVTGLEVDAAALTAGQQKVSASLDRQLNKGRIDTAGRDEIAARFGFTSDFAELADADVVVEAVPERMEIKRDLFGKLDTVCDPGTVLATNTSSLPVTEIAESTNRPDRVVGMHFFNPAPVMKLVEVIHTPHTADEVVDTISGLATDLGKTPVTAGDRPGFIANRLLLGYLNQAAKLVGAAEADRDEVDAAMKAAGLPMGPLMLSDVIGLDTCVEILDCIHQRGDGSPRHEVADVLRKLVAAGKFGKKTGEGFYDHSGKPEDVTLSPLRRTELVAELIPPHVGDAQAMVDSGYASAADIDTAMKLGCGYPNGIFGLLPG